MSRWIFLLGILVMSFRVLAQADNSIGETFVLSITADNRASIDYLVENKAEYVTIQAHSIENEAELFDPVMWIVDSQNLLIAYNDNFNVDNFARIENLLLPPDRYTIWIDSFNGVSEGEVEVQIEPVDPFNEISSVNDDGTITIDVRLPEDAIYRYALELSENDIVTISVRDTSGTLDPYLSILENNSPLLSNDDHQSSDLTLNRLDSRISEWHVLSDNTYIIEVRDFLGNAGEFELVIVTTST